MSANSQKRTFVDTLDAPNQAIGWLRKGQISKVLVGLNRSSDIATLTLMLGRSRSIALSQATDAIVVINGWILLQSDLDGPVR